MHLTDQQRQAIEKGEAVPVTVDHTECIVIRKDVYERVRQTVDPSETYPAVLEAWDSTPEDAELYRRRE